MTDYLEPYRRLARSIRFAPPLHQPRQERVGDLHLSALPLANPSPESKPSASEAKHYPGPTPDPSERTETLIRAAVSKHTVLPVSYSIQENIGDRISHLAAPKSAPPIVILPKIPAPDPNWTPSPPVENKQAIPSQTATARSVTTVETEAAPAAAQLSLDIDSTITAPETEEVREIPINAEPPLAVEKWESGELATLTEGAIEVPQSESSAETAPSDLEPSQSEELASRVEGAIAVPQSESLAETAPSDPEPSQSEELATLTEGAIEVPQSESIAETAPSDPEPPATVQQPGILESVTNGLKNAADALVQFVYQPVEPSVEPEPTEVRQAPNDETIQISCPKCGSTQIRKNGRLKDKQKYACKDCGRNFMLSDSTNNEDNLENQVNSRDRVTADKVSKTSAGFSANTAKTSKTKNKKKRGQK